MAASKAKSKTKSKSAARRAKPKSRKDSGISQVVTSHPFAPGTKVGIHEEAGTGPARAQGDHPPDDPIKFATVAKDGTLKITVPKRGMYAVCGEVEGQSGYQYVTVGVT